MSQVVYRGNLSIKQFPFLTDYMGRSIIVPGNDNTFNRSLTSSEDADRDVGIPTIFYCHNVLPAPFGFQSIGYDQIIPPLGSSGTLFTEAQLLRSDQLASGQNGPRFYFAPTVTGIHYTYVLGSSKWTAITTVIPISSTTKVSYATVQGISYIYFSGIGCYKWDSVLNTLVAVTLTALNVANIIGLAAYQGYTIAFDTNDIYWSSVLDITPSANIIDFTPSLITGASNIRPEGARGPITFVLPATFGLAIYTTANIVSAIYSGNSRYPFNFKEVVASGGCSDNKLVTYDANTGNQYAYTTSGLQTVTATATQTQFPEITDFIAGESFEDFDEVLMAFTTTALSSPMVKKLTSVADRYLVMSYGITALTHAIIYDMTQRRFGKLKIPHVFCFEYQYLDPTIADAPRRSIAFLKQDGSTYLVNPNIDNPLSAGVLMTGKFQYARSRTLTLDEVAVQTVRPGQCCVMWDFASMSGGTLSSCTKTQLYDATVGNETQRVFNAHTTAMNHSLMLVGGFSLASIQLKFHLGARR